MLAKTWILAEVMTLLSRTQVLREKQAANGLTIFFKGGLALAQRIRKSRPTEKALLLGCDELKPECLHVNKKKLAKKRKEKELNKLAMLFEILETVTGYTGCIFSRLNSPSYGYFSYVE